MFNDAGTEVEVSELLWALIRMLKPELVLETGTHKGISSSYIAQGMEDNQKGQLITFEIIAALQKQAVQLWTDLGLTHRITSVLQDALRFDPQDQQFDMLFLDSEPQLRFDEFIRFFPNLKPGGLIIIHDLHPSLGHYGSLHPDHGIYDWPYGDFRKKLGPYIKNHQVQTFSFSTPRGISIFQKERNDFAFVQHIRGEI